MANVNESISFVKRNPKSKAARQRAVSPDAKGVHPQEINASETPSGLAAKLKKQHKDRARPKAALSFGHDEEEGDGEVFEVKKSNLSKRMTLKQHGTSRSVEPDPITPQSAGVVYNKEYLSELRASTSHAVPTPPTNAETILNEAELAGAVIVEQEMPNCDTEIFSETSILAAKQKRERLRKSKPVPMDEDFISLSITRIEDTYQGPHPESRLMREDDDLGEGDDEFAEYTAALERIPLGKKAKKKEAADRRTVMQEMIEDANEEDEETMEWEKEQLRRGAQHDVSTAELQKPRQEYRPAPILENVSLPSLEASISRLSQSLIKLTMSHTSNTASMTSLADEKLALEVREKDMRTMVEKADMKRSWFVSFREWMETVASFLDEKYPILEKLEEEHTSLLKERSSMISKRRLLDDEDDLALFCGEPPKSESSEAEELDEFGRPRNDSVVARRERQAYRASRHAQHPESQDNDGYSTDSSLSPSDETDYRAALANLQTKAKGAMEDVRSDDFLHPERCLGRWFRSWRETYSDTYTTAFGGLGMISAWEFWARMEMLGWDPIEDPRTLDSFNWYHALYTYSRPGLSGAPNVSDDGDVEEHELGPDGDLVSAMISTAVVPRLCKVVQGGAFDPYSSKHIGALVDLSEQIEASTTQDKYEHLQKAVVLTFRRTVEETTATVLRYLGQDVIISNFDPEAIPARRRFLTRRYKLISNMMRWRKSAGENFSLGELVSKLVTECIQPIAEVGWDIGGEEIMEKVMKTLAPELQQTVRSGVSSKL